MADTKFTAGPWEAVGRETYHLIYAKGYGSAIGQFDSYSKGFGPDRLEREANAQLSAAAPELYESVRELIGLIPPEFDESPMVSFAKAALAKARGEAV